MPRSCSLSTNTAFESIGSMMFARLHLRQRAAAIWAIVGALTVAVSALFLFLDPPKTNVPSRFLGLGGIGLAMLPLNIFGLLSMNALAFFARNFSNAAGLFDYVGPFVYVAGNAFAYGGLAYLLWPAAQKVKALWHRRVRNG